MTAKPAHIYKHFNLLPRIYKFSACKLHNSLFASGTKRKLCSMPFNVLQNFVYCLAIYCLCSQIFFSWTKLQRKIALFVQANYHPMRCEISCNLSSELSLKNPRNKERDSRISLAWLLHNTVALRILLTNIITLIRNILITLCLTWYCAGWSSWK